MFMYGAGSKPKGKETKCRKKRGGYLKGCEQEAAIHANHHDRREVLLTQSTSDHKQISTNERGRREDHDKRPPRGPP